jgi:NADH-quinone oxidoreductase subunit E
MLSEEERRGIEGHAGQYSERAAAVTEALMVLQESRGWVSDDAVADIAQALGMSAEDVEAVATFSDLVYRRPVGRHVLLVCDSVSCWIMGYESIIDHLKKRLGIGLGQTTADGMFTLLPIGCLGACEQAPALMVDGQLYGNLTPERVDGVLKRLGGGYDAKATD